MPSRKAGSTLSIFHSKRQPCKDRIVELICKTIPEDGMHIWGTADLSGLLHSRFDGFNSGIVIGKKLDDTVINAISTDPTPEYWKLYQDTNVHLTTLVEELAAKIGALGIKSLAIRPTSSRIDRSPDYAQTLRHDFSHKMVELRGFEPLTSSVQRRRSPN